MHVLVLCCPPRPIDCLGQHLYVLLTAGSPKRNWHVVTAKQYLLNGIGRDPVTAEELCDPVALRSRCNSHST